MRSWSSHSGLYSFFPLVSTLSFWYNIMIKVNQHALINIVYSYMVTKVFNIQPVLFHQYYLCHLLWFKKQSFTLVWKPNPPLLSLLLRACADAVSVGSMKRLLWMCISSRDQWNLTPATICCGSAARRRFGAADHALAQVQPRQFFLLGGGSCDLPPNRDICCCITAVRKNPIPSQPYSQGGWIYLCCWKQTCRTSTVLFEEQLLLFKNWLVYI